MKTSGIVASLCLDDTPRRRRVAGQGIHHQDRRHLQQDRPGGQSGRPGSPDPGDAGSGDNKKGGLAGYQIELIVKDSGSSPEKAISFAKQLIEEDKVFAIIGPSTSGETLKIKAIAEEGRPSSCPVPRLRPS